ncbi:uncharacterized protein LOC131044158 isoform X2 [Cryptomeria japonica]|uniref:uncharacterized protein LOC131044158 isoform X2 n=1 Tax=Cryptomeria japonica TaxID=3369 RepID=UPI0027DA7CAC|nr:uncharacterized protein LOC131044158 isoform X2 [Cryptomeria japonica]
MGGSKKRDSIEEALVKQNEEEVVSSLKKRKHQLENGTSDPEKKKKKKKKKKPIAELPNREENGDLELVDGKKNKHKEVKGWEHATEAEGAESSKKKKKKSDKRNYHESGQDNTNPIEQGFRHTNPQKNDKKKHYDLGKDTTSPSEAGFEDTGLEKVGKMKHHKLAQDSANPSEHTNTNQNDRAEGQPELHMDAFRELSSPDVSVRESATLSLVKELQEIQTVYEQSGTKEERLGARDVQLEAAKDDYLTNCSPTLKYALRRLIRGISSSRAEAREGLLGKMFAYGALVRSGRLEIKTVLASERDAGFATDLTQHVLVLADKKCFMREPAVAIILDLVDRVPRKVLLTRILKASLLKEWLQKDPVTGNPDALLLALKLFDKLPLEMRNLCKMIPHVCSLSDLFTPDNMLLLVPSLKEASFCHPRVHSVWQALLDILFVELEKVTKHPVSCHSSEKTKKSQKRNSAEKNLAKRLACFWEVVVEGTLLQSSHDRKHLAIDIFLMILPRIPASFVQIFLSNKFVQCLEDVLSAKDSHLYKSAQHCLEEVIKWSFDDDERRVAVVIALQVNSDGKFDNNTRTQTVRKLVSKFDTAGGSLLFLQKLIGIFLEGSHLEIDKRSYPDKIHAVQEDEASNVGVKSMDEDGESLPGTASDSDDVLRSWIVDCIYHLSKNASLEPAAKFPLQKEILKFLAVQGLFTASLGIEVTSFELQEKLKWPKKSASVQIRRLCIEQMQHLLADAQRLLISEKHAEIDENMQHELSPLESNDLGAYAMCFLGTLQNIPSVSLFWPLSKDDEHTFNKMLDAETQLFRAAHKAGSNIRRMQAMRFLLIQLLLQIPLKHGEICETATELLICCKEAFDNVINLDVESHNEENVTPAFMDVLIDALLSLLPQSSAPVRVAVEQVFRCFCDSITDSGVMNMLRVVKKDLKPPRRKPIVLGDSDEEDPIEIEESESGDEAEESEDEEHSDDNLEEQEKKDQTESVLEEKNSKGTGDSDDMDSEFDDDAMFRLDTYLAQIVKDKSNAVGSDTAQSQLVNFKLRVLSLLEFYLQRNSNKPIVLTIFSCLLQAFEKNSSPTEGNEQLANRIGVILERKICKAKEYPKGLEVNFSLLEGLLDKVLKLVSRPKGKKIESLAQTCTFWLLKVIHGNLNGAKVDEVSKIFFPSLEGFFASKKCCLKGGFVREVFRRHHWLGTACFRVLVENFLKAKSEFLQCEALSIMDTLIRPVISKSSQNSCQNLQFLEVNLSQLAELIRHLLQRQAKKAFRLQALQFCKGVLEAIQLLKLEKSFAELLQLHELITPESYIGDLLRTKLGLEK